MPSPTILLALALALSLLANVGLGKWVISAKEDTARVQQAYDSFSAQVKAIGEAAQKAADATKQADQKRKEAADAAHAKTTAALNIALNSLRSQRDADRNRNFLPAASAAAGSADSACFDRPLYLGAHGSLVKGLRSLADEGSKAVVDLNAAKEWGQQR